MQVYTKRDNNSLLIKQGQEGQVTSTNCGDGTLKVQRVHGKNQEDGLSGVFTVRTAVTGVNIATSLAGTLIYHVGIFNPPNSGVNCVIQNGYGLWDNGTAGAGGLIWLVSPALNGVTSGLNNQSTIGNTFRLTGSKVGSNSLVTWSGGIVSKFLRNLGGGGTFAGVIGNAYGLVQYDDTQGSIICVPGACVGIGAGAAGTAPFVTSGMTWVEVPIV